MQHYGYAPGQVHPNPALNTALRRDAPRVTVNGNEQKPTWCSATIMVIVSLVCLGLLGFFMVAFWTPLIFGKRVDTSDAAVYTFICLFFLGFGGFVIGYVGLGFCCALCKDGCCDECSSVSSCSDCCDAMNCCKESKKKDEAEFLVY
uniref:Transmembrane protein n=1 Tax=Chromera velia CCMP2878 TaxID=1169474 RepID=A0A0G4I647_9ALVE|eukprot:Cvel_36230.t1-p1 / transcript=Cvel_36230.t1 / gene=Cvel_36230 / organism=Chromera_velia_CCMP2878 / gene_product=hypothetical protein / transcript_product=hypothetical protein / location=Cvel_scaffold7054:1398-1835(-) / protein_length=146 / sequence_SO=supercontig / SO=protein_coding / is_pseudo=false